jgi:hypothetical protein
MKKSLWLSRHKVTNDQLAEALEMGFLLEESEVGNSLGSMNLEDEQDVLAFCEILKSVECEAIFGVFSTPVMGLIHLNAENGERAGVPCYSAWNVMRSVEGGKPTFLHRRWVRIGNLSPFVV